MIYVSYEWIKCVKCKKDVTVQIIINLSSNKETCAIFCRNKF